MNHEKDSDEPLITQGSLAPPTFGPPHQQEVFRKTVYVLHSTPAEPMTLVQRKLANAWLKFAIEEPPNENGWWTMPMSRLRGDIEFLSSNTTHLRAAARRLMRVIFEWDVLAPENKRVGWVAQVLFPGVAVFNGYIQFKIAEEIYRELRRPEIYALIDMAVMRKLTTAAAVQLWEYCVRFENLGVTKVLPWEVFRDKVLGNGEKSSYKEYKTLKKRVLVPCIAQINEATNHYVELIEHKEGRRIASVSFAVRRKHLLGRMSEEKNAKLLDSLTRLHVPATEAQRLLRNHSVEEINAALSYTERRQSDASQPPLEHPAAYFRKALEQKYGLPDAGAQQSQLSTAKQSSKTFDILEAYRDQQRQKARDYYTALSEEERNELAEQYNSQQELPQLKVKARLTKIAETAFMNWLARCTWGEPSQDELLTFSAKLLAAKS